MSDNPNGTVSVRREFRTLSQSDWAQYASAVAGLNAVPSPGSQYDELGQIFSTGASAAFGYAPYLPFLRQLLRAFEQALQRLNPAVTLPYWNTASLRLRSARRYSPPNSRAATAAGLPASSPARAPLAPGQSATRARTS